MSDDLMLLTYECCCMLQCQKVGSHELYLHSLFGNDHKSNDDKGSCRSRFSSNSRIASLFSRQIEKGNAGSASALESMGAKPSICCHVLNIAPI